MIRNTCCPEPLAEGSVVRIEHCAGCNTLSLHFGAVTLRLDHRASQSLHGTLGRALAELGRVQGSLGGGDPDGRLGGLAS
jgi:hypothetical protein